MAVKKGGLSEALVRDALVRATNNRTEAWFRRVYDSHSAGGARLPAQAGDFQFVYRGHYGVIEVKSTAQVTTLPKKNFGEGQLARMYQLYLAGATAQVWVHHTTSSVWRCVPVKHLIDTFKGKSSWDLSMYPETSPTALASNLFS